MNDVNIDDLAANFIASTPDGVMIADHDGVIRFWNAGCARIFGFAADEAQGQSLDIIIPNNLRSRHWKGWQETIRTGTTRYGAGDLLSVPALRKDGTRISVEFSILPFHDGVGKIIGIGAIMRDVTKRFAELKKLREAERMRPGAA